MSEYETVLVAIDRSETARLALERALALAGRLGATVHVLTVVDTTRAPSRFTVADVDDLNRAADRLLEAVVDAVDDRDVDVDAEIRRGRPREVILAYAEEIDADLLVVGRRGRRTRELPAAVVGGTADHLVSHSPVPVVVVPDPDTDTDTAAATTD